MRRLAILSVVTSALLGVLGVAVPEPASAVQTLRGPLAAGATATVDLALGDEDVFEIVVPPGMHPTLAATDVSAGTFVQALVPELGGPHIGIFAGDDPTTWYADLDTNPGPLPVTATLQLSTFEVAGRMTFTLGFAGDLEQQVTAGVPVQATVTHPGDRLVLDFDAGRQDVVTVRVSDLALTTPAPRPAGPGLQVSFRSRFGDGPLTPSAPNVYGPLTLSTDGPFAVVLDPTADRTGTFTVTVEVTPGVLGATAYGVREPVELDRPGRQRRFSLITRGSAATLLRALAPQLTRADGTAGSASFELSLAGATAPVASGTISGQELVTVDAGTLPEGADAVLTVTADAGTTGTLLVSVQLDPGPATPLTLDAANPIALAPGQLTARYSFQAGTGQHVELFVDDVTFSTGFNGRVTFAFESPAGFPATFPVEVTEFDHRQRFGLAADLTGTWTLVVERRIAVVGDDAAGFTATLEPWQRQVVASTATVPLDQAVAVTRPTQDLAVTVPGRAGHRIGVQLLDQAWTGPPTLFDQPQQAALGVAVDGQFSLPGGLRDGAGNLYTETPPLQSDGDVVITVDPQERAVGTARLVAFEAPDITGAIEAAGTPTTVTMDRPGTVASYTLDAAPGEGFALDVSSVTVDDPAVPVDFRIDGPGFGTSGQLTAGSTFWFEAPPDQVAGGTYTLVLDPQGAATATVVLTRARPAVTSSALVLGTARTVSLGRGEVQRLTFRGQAGRRPVLRVPSATVQSGARLLDPAGQVVGLVESLPTAPYTEFPVLAVTGRYTLEIDPPGTATGEVTLTLRLLSDPVRSLALGELTRATWQVGQDPVYLLPVRAGERPTVDVRGMTGTSDPFAVSVLLQDPSGQNVAFADLGLPGTGGTVPPAWLEPPVPATADGTWKVVVVPAGQSSGAVSFVARTTADQVIRGRRGLATRVSVTDPAQNVVLPFTFTPGRTAKVVHWSVQGSTFRQARVRLFGPAGGFDWSIPAVIGRGSSSGTFTPPLGLAGTWRVMLDPVDRATGQAVITFTVVDV